MMRYALLVGLLGLCFSALSMAEVVKVDRVLVKKAERQLLLIKDGKVYRRYRIALGFNPIGHKQQSGDGRTPEGIYRIDYRNPHSQFYRSLHIDYPNTRDTRRARQRGVSPGGEIFIHGWPSAMKTATSAAPKSDWTLGCIAVSNPAIDEIWRLVANGTPIEIRP